MKLRKSFLGRIGIIVCAVATGVYVYTLYRDCMRRAAEWNVQAQDAFVEALGEELLKRKDISISVMSVGTSGMATLEIPYQDTVTVRSRYGEHKYWNPRVKFDNSVIKETHKRMLLSCVLEKSPLDPAALNRSWDSLLVEKSIAAVTGIRLSTTDLLKKTSVVYSPDSTQVLRGDSLLSRYLGFRCEVEATGFVSYPWRQLLEAGPSVAPLLLLWGCFFLLLLCHRRIAAFLRRRFMKKETVAYEEKIVIARKMYPEEVVEQPRYYELADGTLLDVKENCLSNGGKVQRLRPQSVVLLKLFLSSKHHRLTAEEIDWELWKGKGTPNQLNVALSRLRGDLKEISLLVIVLEKEYYCLKMPDFIDKKHPEM